MEKNMRINKQKLGLLSQNSKIVDNLCDFDKYSVLFSLYNKEKPEYLVASIESMIHQTLKPDEIVVVKDGPITMELEAVLDNYVAMYPNIFTIVGYECNKGLGVALNYGLNHCRNELVARMDTDDIAMPNRCELQVDFFRKFPKVTIVGGQIEEFLDKTGSVVGKRVVPLTDKELKQYIKKRCPFNHMTVMFRKSHIQSVGSYLDWFWNEDYYLWIRLAIAKYIFANLSETLVSTRVGDDMYQRRGGKKYFKSELRIQNLMLKEKMINPIRYAINIMQRIVVELLLPNQARSWVFQKFARK